MPYTVCVDDNFHFMDESERYTSGTYETYEEALAAAKAIVDRSLAWAPGETPESLYEGYKGFGEDPFIQGPDPCPHFSAWEYARQRCREICEEHG